MTRLSEEKASELHQINRRNEMLIMQMCEAHKNEVRCLRDRISELERQIRLGGNIGPSVENHYFHDSQVVDRSKANPSPTLS